MMIACLAGSGQPLEGGVSEGQTTRHDKVLWVR